MLEYVNPIKILALITFLYSLTLVRKPNVNYRMVSAVLLVCVVNEVINSLLAVYNAPNAVIISLAVIVHHSLWLLLLGHNISGKLLARSGLVIFIAFATINLLLFQGWQSFNYYTFVIGGFIYIAVFILESFAQLRQENFSFFLSNTYILLFAPVLFFFGLSAMFGFDSRDITSAMILPGIKLYHFIAYFVDIIYYGLIIIYIRREKRLAYAQ